MLPSIFGANMFEDWPFGRDMFDMSPLYGRHGKNLMKTDVREKDGAYEVAVDIPGFKKEDVSVKLENGYLNVTAQKSEDKETKDDKGGYLRKERYEGCCTRSFYVGEELTEKDIKAKMEDGVLMLAIPKKETKRIEGEKFISIE